MNTLQPDSITRRIGYPLFSRLQELVQDGTSAGVLTGRSIAKLEWSLDAGDLQEAAIGHGEGALAVEPGLVFGVGTEVTQRP